MTVNSNHETLLSYEACFQKYINGTHQEVTGGVKKWIDAALSHLPLNARILEFGSAFGRDADYMKSLGYDVECTDAVQGFVTYLKEKGFNARLYNAITDTLKDRYDLIYANAVLLHFTREETTLVLSKVAEALKENGRFAFCLKSGNGEAWSNGKLGAPRYFCYWTQAELEDLLKKSSFIHWTIDDDGTGHDSGEWLSIIAFKS